MTPPHYGTRLLDIYFRLRLFDNTLNSPTHTIPTPQVTALEQTAWSQRGPANKRNFGVLAEGGEGTPDVVKKFREFMQSQGMLLEFICPVMRAAF
jgi:hypothetical protein